MSMYNDKDYIWANHSEAVINDQRKKFKSSLHRLLLS